MSVVGNLKDKTENWTAGGVSLPSMITTEMRKGKETFVIEKALVKLDGAMFKLYEKERETWYL